MSKRKRRSKLTKKRAGRPGEPAGGVLPAWHFYRTTNFRYVHVHRLVKALGPLTAGATNLLVIGEPGPKGLKYYLSTPKLLGEALEQRPERSPASRARRLLRIRLAIRRAGVRLPIFSALAEVKVRTPAGLQEIARSPLLLEVRGKEPKKLVVTDVSRLGEKVSPELREAITEAIAGEATGAAVTVGGTGEGTFVTAQAPREEAASGAPASPAPRERLMRTTPLKPPKGWTRAKPPERKPGFGVTDSAPPPGAAVTRLEQVGDFGGDFEVPRFLRTEASDGGVEVAEAAGGTGAGVGEGSLSLPVYPEIEVTDRHPVQGDPIDVFVSLNFEKSETTTGFVSVPEDAELHVFDVHLLLGDEVTKWEKLEFKRPGGTVKPAEFKGISAPLVRAARLSQAAHPVFDITVNFYLNNRWCGEAVTRIEVRASASDSKLALIERPETPVWRKYLHAAPDAPPPDLLIRIKKGNVRFEWQLLSPHMNFSEKLGDMTAPTGEPYRFVKDSFEIFAGATLSDDDIYALHASCDAIYRSTPEGFQAGYRTLLRKAAEQNKKIDTIQIISDEPFIPWELMRVPDPLAEAGAAPEILCVKHSVGRWIAPSSTELRNRLRVERLAVAASKYAKPNVPNLEELPWAEEERNLLTSPPYNAGEIPMQLQKLIEFIRTGLVQPRPGSDSGETPVEMVHFSCHGNTDPLAPEKAALRTVDDLVGLRATLVATFEARTQGAGKTRPFVFLNACQAAVSGTTIGMVFGWPEAFLEMGATACVAPLWRVVDRRAKDIAKEFYELALAGKDGGEPLPLGEALRRIRAVWNQEKSLTHLGYQLYGDPTAKLVWSH